MGLTQTPLVVRSAIAVLTLLALQTYLSEYSIGFASGQHTIIQRNARSTVKATGPDSPAGGFAGSIKSDHDTIIQEGVHSTVETTGPDSPAGGFAGSIKDDHNTITQEGVCSTVKTTGPDSPAGGFAGSIKGDHNTITQKGVRSTVKTTGSNSPAGGFVGSFKGDHNTITQVGGQVFVETTGPGSPAGGFAGCFGDCNPGVKTGNSHGNDYSGGDGDHNDNHGESLVDEVPEHHGHTDIRNHIPKHNNFGLLNCNDITLSGGLNMSFVCTKGISECVVGNPTARGLGIIITNDYSQTLPGTCKDGYNLLDTLVHSDFIVLWLHNINKQTISDLMDEVKSLEEHESREFIKKYECILFAFSGHGLNNKYIMMQDSSIVNIETDILEPLLPSSIRKFGEVPKVLLIDACRGSSVTATVSTKFALDVITKETVPAEGNYLLACSTMPGHYSFMYTKGSAWIQEFAHLARESTKSVEGILVNVNENLNKLANRKEIEFLQPDMYVRLLREVHIYRNTITESSDQHKYISIFTCLLVIVLFYIMYHLLFH